MFMKKFRLLSALTALMLLVSAAAPVRATQGDVAETTAPVETTTPPETTIPMETESSRQKGLGGNLACKAVAKRRRGRCSSLGIV